MNSNKIIVIKKCTWLYVLFWFSFIKPGMYYFVPKLNIYGDIYNAFQLLFSLIVISLFFIYYIDGIDEFFVVLIAYMTYLLGISIIRGTSIIDAMLFAMRIMSPCFLVCMSNKRSEIRECLNGVIIALAISVSINALTILAYCSRGGIYPDIIMNGYYLGYDNVHIIYTLPFLVLSMFYDLYYEGRLRIITILLHGVIVLTVLMTKSGTSIIAIILFYLCSIMLERKGWLWISNEWVVVLGNVCVWIYFVLWNNYTKMIRMLQRVSGKNLYDVRHRIWNRYEKIISIDGFLWGHGYLSDYQRQIKVGIVHAHNMYLDLVYEVGLIGLAIFLLLVFLCIKNARTTRTPYGGIIISGIISFLIAFQVEAYNKVFFVVILAFLFYFSSNKDNETIRSKEFAKKRYGVFFHIR